MSPRDQWSKLDRSQIEAEIELRKKLIGEMVGQLYPAILQSEIEDLIVLRDELSRKLRP